MASLRLCGSMASISDTVVTIETSICPSSSLVSVIGTCIPEGKSGFLSQFSAVPNPF